MGGGARSSFGQTQHRAVLFTSKKLLLQCKTQVRRKRSLVRVLRDAMPEVFVTSARQRMDVATFITKTKYPDD